MCETKTYAVVSHNTEDFEKYVILGLINDSIIDNYMLREIDDNLKYILPFKMKQKKNVLKCNIIYDIMMLRRLYLLEGEIETNDTIDHDDTKVYSAPRIYILPEMKLFNQEIPKSVIYKPYIHITNSKKTIFILIPYNNPIIRYKIISNCMDTDIKDSEKMFLVTSHHSLIVRYLEYNKFPSDYIIRFPTCISKSNDLYEIYTFIQFFFDMEMVDIYLGVSSQNMTDILMYSKYLRLSGKVKRKFRFICE
jgi:hypothetical protein